MSTVDVEAAVTVACCRVGVAPVSGRPGWSDVVGAGVTVGLCVIVGIGVAVEPVAAIAALVPAIAVLVSAIAVLVTAIAALVPAIAVALATAAAVEVGTAVGTQGVRA